jgi:hypothetical protein
LKTFAGREFLREGRVSDYCCFPTTRPVPSAGRQQALTGIHEEGRGSQAGVVTEFSLGSFYNNHAMLGWYR